MSTNSGWQRFLKGGQGRWRHAKRLVAFAGLAAFLVTPLLIVHDRQVAAAPIPKYRLLTAQDVVAAFQAQGLAVENLHQQPVQQGSPSGPPQGEREAWTFSVPGIAPSGGRILVFSDDEKLKKKTDWFARVGAGGHVEVQNNVVVWLDSRISPAQDARYRQVLHGIR